MDHESAETTKSTNLEVMRQEAQELEKLLRLQSPPIGLKMLASEEQIPGSAKRPKRDLGHHMSFCQALAYARRYGVTIAQTIEDMWCFEPVIGLGFAEPPKSFLEGANRYPENARTPEAGSTWAKNFPRFDYGQYSAVLFAPLGEADFEPDIFLVYGEPAKMTMILLAKNWFDGKDITTTMSGHAACVYYVVPAMKDKGLHINSPCGGDLRRAACETNNMVFSAPIGVLSDLVEGLKYIYKHGFGLPLHVCVETEYPMTESYAELAKSMGMNWAKTSGARTV